MCGKSGDVFVFDLPSPSIQTLSSLVGRRLDSVPDVLFLCSSFRPIREQPNKMDRCHGACAVRCSTVISACISECFSVQNVCVFKCVCARPAYMYNEMIKVVFFCYESIVSRICVQYWRVNLQYTTIISFSIYFLLRLVCNLSCVFSF